jgi:hypothetical protein
LVPTVQSPGQGNEPVSNRHPALDVTQGRQRLQVIVGLHHQPGRCVAAKVLGQPGGGIGRDRVALLDDLVNAGRGTPRATESEFTLSPSGAR